MSPDWRSSCKCFLITYQDILFIFFGQFHFFLMKKKLIKFIHGIKLLYTRSQEASQNMANKFLKWIKLTANPNEHNSSPFSSLIFVLVSLLFSELFPAFLWLLTFDFGGFLGLLYVLSRIIRYPFSHLSVNFTYFILFIVGEQLFMTACFPVAQV